MRPGSREDCQLRSGCVPGPRTRDEAGVDAGVIGKSYGGPAFGERRPSSANVSRRMARTGRRDTKPELELRRALFARGLRYRVDAPDRSRQYAGAADIVFAAAKVAVFVDGCFWHGCPDHATWPKANEEFWREKIETNRLRDRDTDRRLAEAGWSVVRVWEHEDARPGRRPTRENRPRAPWPLIRPIRFALRSTRRAEDPNRAGERDEEEELRSAPVERSSRRPSPTRCGRDFPDVTPTASGAGRRPQSASTKAEEARRQGDRLRRSA